MFNLLLNLVADWTLVQSIRITCIYSYRLRFCVSMNDVIAIACARLLRYESFAFLALIFFLDVQKKRFRENNVNSSCRCFRKNKRTSTFDLTPKGEKKGGSTEFRITHNVWENESTKVLHFLSFHEMKDSDRFLMLYALRVLFIGAALRGLHIRSENVSFNLCAGSYSGWHIHISLSGNFVILDKIRWIQISIIDIQR